MSSELPEDFADRLTALQRTDDASRQRYERRMNAAFEEPLAGVRKARYALRFATCVVLLGYCAYALAVRTDLDTNKRRLLASAAVASVAWIAYLWWTFQRGTVNVRFTQRAKKYVMLAEIIIAAPLVIGLTSKLPDTIHSVILLLTIILFVVTAAAIQVRMMINEMRMKLEERTVELQFRLEELAEELKRNK